MFIKLLPRGLDGPFSDKCFVLVRLSREGYDFSFGGKAR